MAQLLVRAATFHIAAVQAYLKNVRIKVSYTKIKAYDDAGEPDVLEFGDATYTFSAEMGYIDSTEMDLALARTKSSVILYPTGEVAGDIYTLANCVFDYEIVATRNGILLANVTGEGISLAKTTI